jgi:hypothetical protein
MYGRALGIKPHKLNLSCTERGSAVSYVDFVIGAATFDLSGLPKEYFVTVEGNDISWIQTIFQGLGLQALLTSCLELGVGQHTVIHSKEYRAVVVKQRVRYVAFLLCYTNAGISEEFVRWAQNFEPTQLRTHDRFSSV